MSPTPLTSSPRLLLFPQVGRPDGTDGRPAVRRYTLTLLPVRQVGRTAGPGPAKPSRQI